MPEQSQKQSVYYKQNSLKISSSLLSHIQTKPYNQGKNSSLKLSCALQASQNIHDLIKIYSDNIQHIVSHDSIRFENKLMNIDITLGTTARHSCSYNLTFSNTSLGRLSLTRNKLFSENDLTRFEDLLSELFYPLGNAIYNL